MTEIRADLAKKVLNITVVVASLGYFIDQFDFFIFNVLRVKSLTDLGLTGQALTHSGLFISNCQLAGLVIGAYLSGLVGDKWGRKTSLFLSIIIYSLGSLACAFVTKVSVYGLARFTVGVGIAGELGAGIVIISETLRADRRGFGVMGFIIMGPIGIITAATVAEFFPWRTAYLIAAAAGLILLFTRVLLSESGLFEQLKGRNVQRGGLRIILRDRRLLKKYIGAILLVLPAIFVTQIMWTLSPELGKAAGIGDPLKASSVIAAGFGAGIFCDVGGMSLSAWLGSRKRAALVFLCLAMVSFLYYILWPARDLTSFYIANALLGTCLGIWIVGAVWAAENFGTNIRATATTTIPNFARGIAIAMNLAYGQLKLVAPITAVSVIGGVIFLCALIGWSLLPETYGRDLDFVEEG